MEYHIFAYDRFQRALDPLGGVAGNDIGTKK